MTEDISPEEAARRHVMLGVHQFAAECLVLFGDDSQIGVCARRLAQRLRYQLIVGEDPDRAEVRDRVVTAIEARRERIRTLLAE